MGIWDRCKKSHVCSAVLLKHFFCFGCRVLAETKNVQAISAGLTIFFKNVSRFEERRAGLYFKWASGSQSEFVEHNQPFLGA